MSKLLNQHQFTKLMGLSMVSHGSPRDVAVDGVMAGEVESNGLADSGPAAKM